MNTLIRLFLVAPLMFPVSVFALAMDCPISISEDDVDSTRYVDQVTALIQKQEACGEAKALAEACSFGSSMDGVIAGEAISLCEKSMESNLMVKISSAKTAKAKAAKRLEVAKQRKLYEQTRDLCDVKYQGVEGTLGVSVMAFCYLDVAYWFDQLFTPSAVGAQD